MGLRLGLSVAPAALAHGSKGPPRAGGTYQRHPRPNGGQLVDSNRRATERGGRRRRHGSSEGRAATDDEWEGQRARFKRAGAYMTSGSMTSYRALAALRVQRRASIPRAIASAISSSGTPHLASQSAAAHLAPCRPTSMCRRSLAVTIPRTPWNRIIHAAPDCSLTASEFMLKLQLACTAARLHRRPQLAPLSSRGRRNIGAP